MSLFDDDPSNAMNIARDIGLIEGYLIRSGADPRVLAALERIAGRFGDDEEGPALEEEETEEEEVEDDSVEYPCKVCGIAAEVDDEGTYYCTPHWDELEAKREQLLAAEKQKLKMGNKKKQNEAEAQKRREKFKEEDRAWSQHRGDGESTQFDFNDQPEGNEEDPGLPLNEEDPDAAAEEIKAAVRKRREWTPAEDKLIIDYSKTKQKVGFILDEINRISPDNPRTITALYTRMTALRGKGELE